VSGPGTSGPGVAGSSGSAGAHTLSRRAVVARILADRGEALVVAGLGSTNWDATAAGDHPLTFPLWGAMGGAAMTGLGLAIAQPGRRVLVITGDGEMLMGLGALATIAVQRPANLAVVVIDNERYGETGQQLTHTAHGVDLPGMAAAAGFPSTGTLATEAALEEALGRIHSGAGPVFYSVKVAPERPPLVMPDRDGPWLKARFRQALLGTND
jgi:thiamine pyrophosphate-dependent acetolactate synthase large subunit-like protein